MTDAEIIDRFRQRDENAVLLTDRQYGAQCRAMARHILKNAEDAEECVNDGLLRLWDSIPPARPQSLLAYLSRIVRNLSLDRLRERTREKRGGGAVPVPIDELAQLAGRDDVEDRVNAKELGRAINGWLRTLPERQCSAFLLRYYYFAPREEIAVRLGISAAQVSVELSRTRKRLAQFLKKEGYL